jgi:hypothetical protein
MAEECSTIINGIIVGAVGGSLAGVTVYMAKYIHDKIQVCSEKRRIYRWMKDVISQNKDGIRYLSTRKIASHNNLTEDRVRYICSIHEYIYLSTGEKEGIWGVKDLSGRN